METAFLNGLAMVSKAPLSSSMVLLISGIVFRGLRNAPLWKWFAIASGGSLLVAPHVYPYDGTLFVLPLWLILFHSKLRVARPLAAVFSTPLPFFTFVGGEPWTALPACLLLLIVISLAFEREPPEDSEPVARPEASAGPA